MNWQETQASFDRGGGRLPPPNANEIELTITGFKEKYVDPLWKLLNEGDTNDEIRHLHNVTVYSDWKDLPNFRFRLMVFPTSPHSDNVTDISDFRISGYIEAAKKEDWPENWVCYGTRFCMFIINYNNLSESIYKRDTFNFSSTELDRGWQGILTFPQIMENGFLSEKGDLTIRAGVYPIGSEVNRSSREGSYNCRKMTGFVGLQNHGATCYMNALLQSLYSITKFRKAVYLLNFKESEMIGQKSFEIIKRLDSRMNESLSPVESSADSQKSSKRKTMEYEDVSKTHPEVGMEDSVDLNLDGDLDERECCAILMDEEEEQKKVPSVGLALQNLFYKLKYSPHAPPCKELMKSFGWDSSDMFTQQDSHELLKLLLDKMEEQMKGTPVEGSVKHMFEGEMETYIECIDIDYKSCRKETFEDIQLDIQGCSDIYESLKKLTEAEILSGENMYEAEGHGKQRARKGIRFLKFPPVCVFLLKRFTFDLQRMDTVKLNDRFEFYKEIDLSPFCPGAGKYVLQAVSVHHGSINSGHYYAFAASDKGEWYRFDDENVSKVSEYAVIGDNFGGEEPDCVNYCVGESDHHPRIYRRPKNYNAYILIYVLKSAVGDILGDCDPIKEKYGMIDRCRLQERLSATRRRIRERLNQFIKIKVYEKQDFEGHKFMDQPFIGWPGGKTVTFERSTSIADALRHIGCHVISSNERNDLFSPENYHVMGLSRNSNRFQCVGDIKQYHSASESLQLLISLIRRDVFQIYDPTIYMLYVLRPAHLNGTSATCPLLIVKYFDIFCENPDVENLVCMDMVYVSPNRSISQVAGVVLTRLLHFMREGLVIQQNMEEIERCVSRLGMLGDIGKSGRELDAEIEKIMHEEMVYMNWYVELAGMYDAVAVNKTLVEQQINNGDLLVFNLRPTESMRRLIEETDSKFTIKEDFEPSKPVVDICSDGPFVHCSEEYMKTSDNFGKIADAYRFSFDELYAQWGRVADAELVRQQKLNFFPIYDFPSFCDWRLSVVSITFKLYNPLEDLGSWMNCCNAPVKNQGGSAEHTSRSLEELQLGAGSVKTMKFTLDLRTPCKHALRYVCWAMGVDPAHTLFYSHQPHKLESIWLSPASLDDFCHRDGSLGFVQKPLSELFQTLGKAVRHETEMADSVIRSNSITSNAQCSDRSYENIQPTDLGNYNGTPTSRGGALALPSTAGTTNSISSVDLGGVPVPNTESGYRSSQRLAGNVTAAESRQQNVIFMAVLPMCYRSFVSKEDGNSLNFVAQIFNTRVEIVGACMGKVSTEMTVGAMCTLANRMVKDTSNVSLRLVECISDVFVVVDPSTFVRDLPHYTNTNIRNLLAAPLRFEPDWTMEERDLLHRGERVILVVMHQTPDHESFGHPFEVLVSPHWTLGEIKNTIKDKLCLSKREWDRWSFFQQMDGYNRTWKANDDKLDWDKSQDIKLLAEHPKPYEKSRSYSAMRIA
ncbi:ubiquitin carboxyl-terminal hydrolase domain containing protein [Babesia gibsoni]|uniref:Ubiquitin carboxyl-terminal hydrolase domain containing protein n=1 Tax=Babesia gibsoni TaxID=33632 RepID=A0AAD8LP99_BABGI|nr:ubiquitin carboxyl-terminal hydrolase domain containing protein [Babesia gibsoni]